MRVENKKKRQNVNQTSYKGWKNDVRKGGKRENYDDVCDDNRGTRRREGRKGRRQNKLTSHHSPCRSHFHSGAAAGLRQPLPPDSGLSSSHSQKWPRRSRPDLFRFCLWQSKQANNFSSGDVIKFERALSHRGWCTWEQKARSERERMSRGEGNHLFAFSSRYCTKKGRKLCNVSYFAFENNIQYSNFVFFFLSGFAAVISWRTPAGWSGHAEDARSGFAGVAGQNYLAVGEAALVPFYK